jgi:hypothetical protein
MKIKKDGKETEETHMEDVHARRISVPWKWP